MRPTAFAVGRFILSVQRVGVESVILSANRNRNTAVGQLRHARQSFVRLKGNQQSAEAERLHTAHFS
jgi:hypothetical protein